MSVCSFVSTQAATSSQSPTSSSSSSSQSNPTQTICSGLNDKPILTLKTSPKQVLMLNSNRINLSPSHPSPSINSPDSSLQYVVKKSPTILILSKPKAELSPRAVPKTTKSSSNLISSYFNNKQNSSPTIATPTQYNFLMPNSKPIPLIPIGKLTPNTNTSNFTDNFNGSQLIPIETIEISTATIEINSTDEQVQVAETTVVAQSEPTVVNEVEVKIEQEESEEEDEEERVEEKMDEDVDEPKPNMASKSDMNKSDVTRCICEMDHDDGFMICCDNCLVWQHIACMEVNKKKIPDKFYCEKCVPRPINAPRAKQIQEKYLKNVSKNTSKIKNRRNSSSSNTTSSQTPQHENEQIESKSEPIIDEPMPDEANVLSPAGSDQNDPKSKLKRRYKSRTIREEFENKQIDETNPNEYSKTLLDKIQFLDLKQHANMPANNSNDLLKVIKVKNKKVDESDEQKYRVKVTQNIMKDQFVAEFIGHITDDLSTTPENYSLTIKIPTNSELKPCTSSSSSSSTSNLNDLETLTVIIDSNKIYNNTRFVRKSCLPNTRLEFVKDSNSNFRVYIQAVENIAKNTEIFLPVDLSCLANSICLCESNDCDLRQKLTGKNTKTSPIKPAKKEVKVERRPSTNSPAPLVHTPVEDLGSKNLSREDRKLASYMRVIEKLEKQGKRKREAKPREKSADKSVESEKNPIEKENEKVEKLVEKNSKKSKTNRPSLLIQQQISDQIDQEIASITESNRQESEEIKPSVKSPDYSFVNLSIEPRRTLNLLQRNLNDSNDENRFSPALESLENNKNFLQKSFFHPKKHWLKTCCSNENTQTDGESSPSKAEASSQPPKKRRIFIAEEESDEKQPGDEQLSIQPVQPVFIPLPEHQFYLNFMNLMPQMSSPNFPILNSAPLSSASNCSTPNFYTPNFYDPFAFHHQIAAMSMYPNLIQPVIPSIPSPQSSVNEANAETAKKKVSLAEYRQRKETVKPSEVLFESISSSKSFNNNDDSLCELDVYPTNAEKSDKNRDSSSCSSRCSRKSSFSNISDISSCSSVRSRSPSSSSKRSHSSRLSSFEKQKETEATDKSQEPKYFKFKYKQEDNLKRKLLDDMLDEYRNEGLKLKRKSRTRSCSLNRSVSESPSDSSFDENWRKRSDRKKHFYTHRSNSLNRRSRRAFDKVRASRSNEDNYLKYKYKKLPKFDLRYQLKNKSHFSKSYGSSSCSSSSSISSSNEISSLSSVVKKF